MLLVPGSGEKSAHAQSGADRQRTRADSTHSRSNLPHALQNSRSHHLHHLHHLHTLLLAAASFRVLWKPKFVLFRTLKNVLFPPFFMVPAGKERCTDLKTLYSTSSSIIQYLSLILCTLHTDAYRRLHGSLFKVQATTVLLCVSALSPAVSILRCG
jgi:hypothetical protein